VITIDTNILLRYALNDNPKLSSKAREIIEGNTCYVPVLVLAEMGFVLGSVYETSPPDIVTYTKSLMQQKNIRFENESRILQALAGVLVGIDWFDAMLWAASPAQSDLLTFDKKFSSRAKKLGWKPSVLLAI
jgi:predicted nucleic-acid-binding protein